MEEARKRDFRRETSKDSPRLRELRQWQGKLVIQSEEVLKPRWGARMGRGEWISWKWFAVLKTPALKLHLINKSQYWVYCCLILKHIEKYFRRNSSIITNTSHRVVIVISASRLLLILSIILRIVIGGLLDKSIHVINYTLQALYSLSKRLI